MMIIVDGDKDKIREMIHIISAREDLRLIIIDDEPKKTPWDQMKKTIGEAALAYEVSSEILKGLEPSASQEFIAKKMRRNKEKWQK